MNYIIIIIIIIVINNPLEFFTSVLVFQWSLSDRKSLRVSGTP